MQGIIIVIMVFTQKFRLLWLAFNDRRTPLLAKVLVIGGILYGAAPVDLIPDVIPLFGQLDDIAVLIVILVLFLRMTKSVREDLRRETIIDVPRKY